MWFPHCLKDIINTYQTTQNFNAESAAAQITSVECLGIAILGDKAMMNKVTMAIDIKRKCAW